MLLGRLCRAQIDRKGESVKMVGRFGIRVTDRGGGVEMRKMHELR